MGAMNICITFVEVLKKKEIHDETQFTTKIDCFKKFQP
jgi:hypothetical protein